MESEEYVIPKWKERSFFYLSNGSHETSRTKRDSFCFPWLFLFSSPHLQSVPQLTSFSLQRNDQQSTFRSKEISLPRRHTDLRGLTLLFFQNSDIRAWEPALLCVATCYQLSWLVWRSILFAQLRIWQRMSCWYSSWAALNVGTAPPHRPTALCLQLYVR